MFQFYDTTWWKLWGWGDKSKGASGTKSVAKGTEYRECPHLKDMI